MFCVGIFLKIEDCERVLSYVQDCVKGYHPNIQGCVKGYHPNKHKLKGCVKGYHSNIQGCVKGYHPNKNKLKGCVKGYHPICRVVLYCGSKCVIM